jgi:catechol 2,3-dioxygenase
MEKRANQGLPEPGIAIGHVHLRVSDLDRAMAFYKSTLGFEVTHRTAGGGVFLSAGGSHALIGLNTGSSAEGQAPAVRQFAIRYPDRPALARALNRATSSGAPVDGGLDHGIFEAFYLHDPDGHLIELYYDRSPEDAGVEAVAAARPLDLAALRLLAAETSTAAPAARPPLSADLKDRLREVRLRLLDLHKVLLDDTKAAYELDRGRIPSNATLLQLVINDPWFAWLRPLSELVVRIDVALQPDGATNADGAMLLDQVERLLSPPQSIEPFAQRYYEALQRQPAVITAHGDVRRVLKRPK